MDKKFNARVQHKIDTQENWEKATNFIPLKGELIIYDIDANNTSRRIKIGDGITPVNDLKFVSAQSDYEQNDSSKSDYIKNRTHYKEIIHQERVDLLPATEIDFPSLEGMGYTQTKPLNVQEGDTVKVLWDSQEYECTAQLIPPVESGWPDDMIAFGNLNAFEIDDPDSYEVPFVVISNYSFGESGFVAGSHIMTMNELTNPITVNIFTGGDKIVYHKLDLNYLPLSSSNISENDNTIITSKPLLNYLRANQSDWDVSDSDDPRYIQNRPFHRELWGTTTRLSSRTIHLDENGIYTSQEQLYNFNDIWDNSYGDINLTVYWHDGTYNCKLRHIYTEWTDEQGKHQSYSCFVFGNVSDIDSYNDTAPFLIYADFNPETHKIGETYIKAYDGFTGDISLQIDIEYRYWGYYTLDNKYLDISSLQARWNEENNSAPSYIHDKPCYRYRTSNHDGISGLFELSNEGTYISSNSYFNIDERLADNEPVDRSNITINVKWNNKEYNCRIRNFVDEYTDDGGNTVKKSYYVFGNVSSIDSNYSDTAPFLIYANYNPQTHEYGETYIVSQDGSTGEVSHEFWYSYEYWDYQKLDNKYLNLSTNVSQGDNSAVTGDAVYKAVINNVSVYTHPDTHPASMITEDENHRFVSDTEKAAWNNKVDKADGKGLSTNDYTTADKEKLDGISEGANNYTHPDTHPASMIEEDVSHRFVSDTEKAAWNNISNHTHPASMIEEDASHRFVSDTEKAAWNNKSNSDHNHDSDYLKLSGGTLTGDLVLNGDPTSDNVAANKKYVDDAIALSIGNALGGSY